MQSRTAYRPREGAGPPVSNQSLRRVRRDTDYYSRSPSAIDFTSRGYTGATSTGGREYTRGNESLHTSSNGLRPNYARTFSGKNVLNDSSSRRSLSANTSHVLDRDSLSAQPSTRVHTNYQEKNKKDDSTDSLNQSTSDGIKNLRLSSRSSSSPRVLECSDSIRDLQGFWDDSFWLSCKCSIAGLGQRRKTTPRALVGLSNLGNTCFMNSVLQCLVNTAPLSAYFVADEYSGELNRSSKSWQLVDDYASLAKDMWRTAGNTHTSINPSALKMQISRWARQFSGYEQHDSQELLRFLLDGLQEGLMRPKREPPWPYDDKDFEKRAIAEQSRRMWENYLARNNSQITDIFCGQLRSRVTCATCKRESNCYDPFMDLSLPIPKKFQGLSKWRSSAQECKLQDCLEQFVDEEKLEGNEMYYCSRCKKHQVAIKEMKIFRCPLVLVLHLKRFDKRSSSRSKLNASVRFPTASLELAPYMSSDSPDLSTSTFDLYGISQHSGSLDGGHYIAHCRNFDDGLWYCFNDTRVTKVGSSPPVDESAYLLFYCRRA